jgi:hypothetical protein
MATMAAMALVLSSVAAEKADVGAIYFGDWAPNPWMEAMHGANWTEWVLPVNAQPRYPGHHQPNLPITTKGWGPKHPESDVTNMAVKIDAAADHGIDFFMFDFYWYAETGGVAPGPGKSPHGFFPKTAKGGAFLEAALNAFVAAPNSKRLKFCLHFCNQDWVDVHPAKHGYHATGTLYTPHPIATPHTPHCAHSDHGNPSCALATCRALDGSDGERRSAASAARRTPEL